MKTSVLYQLFSDDLVFNKKLIEEFNKENDINIYTATREKRMKYLFNLLFEILPENDYVKIFCKKTKDNIIGSNEKYNKGDPNFIAKIEDKIGNKKNISFYGNDIGIKYDDKNEITKDFDKKKDFYTPYSLAKKYKNKNFSYTQIEKFDNRQIEDFVNNVSKVNSYLKEEKMLNLKFYLKNKKKYQKKINIRKFGADIFPEYVLKENNEKENEKVGDFEKNLINNSQYLKILNNENLDNKESLIKNIKDDEKGQLDIFFDIAIEKKFNITDESPYIPLLYKISNDDYDDILKNINGKKNSNDKDLKILKKYLNVFNPNYTSYIKGNTLYIKNDSNYNEQIPLDNKENIYNLLKNKYLKDKLILKNKEELKDLYNNLENKTKSKEPNLLLLLGGSRSGKSSRGTKGLNLDNYFNTGTDNMRACLFFEPLKGNIAINQSGYGRNIGLKLTELFKIKIKDNKESPNIVIDTPSDSNHTGMINFFIENKDTFQKPRVIFKTYSNELYNILNRTTKRSNDLPVRKPKGMYEHLDKNNRNLLKKILNITNKIVDLKDKNQDAIIEDGEIFYNGKDVENKDSTSIAKIDFKNKRIEYDENNLKKISHIFVNEFDYKGASETNLIVKDPKNSKKYMNIGTLSYLLNSKTEKILKVLEYNKKLELSGTPFKILNDNEYSNEEIYNWTYSDEQKKKKENEYLGERNPYKDLPEMKIWTFDGVRKLLDNSLYEYDFNLNELFTTRKYKREMADLIEFSNLESVKRLIDFLCGNKFDLIEDRDIKESNVILPYFQDMRDKNKKSLWFLPNVDSVRAMENLLRNHIFFKDYYIINATGKGEGSSKKSLEKYNEVGKTKDKIIILSCGMLNTGVTMKSLNSVIVLQQKNSVQDFFQSIFRCQSPNPPSKKFCYVFDFNPKKYFDNIIEFVKTNYNKDNDDKKNIEDNLIETFLYLDGKMEKTTYETLMSYVTLDNNPEKIKKSFEKANMMNIDLLYSFKDNKEIMDIIDSIPMYRNEKNTIKEEENKKEKPLKDETEEEKKKRLEKEKERKIIQQENKKKKKETDYDIRKQKLNVLISSLSIFIYITNAEEKNLKEIINTREKELFKKICFVSIDNFNKLYENKFFKEEILSKAIYSFWKEERISRDWNELIEDRVVGIK